MAYDFSSFKGRAEEITEWLQREFSTVRTGRATPVLLDSIQVESYGARVSLQQVGNIGIEDPKTLRVAVWDKDQIQQVERAILDADLGVSVATDESGLRVIFPELTSERREQLLKLAKSKYEEARISLRAARDEVVRALESAEKSGDLSEDERFNAKEELQSLVDTKNKEFDEMLSNKESEINQ